MHILRAIRHITLLAMPFVYFTTPASAHHVMGGKLPSTFAEGLLSGLGHPLIGPEHLAVLLGVGVLVGAGGLSLLLPAAFIAAMAAGVAAHVSGISLPAAEILVALSGVMVGFLLVRGRALPTLAWGVLFAFTGFLHGYAFGESIYGAEAAPLSAYLLGLVAVQSVLTTGVALVVRRMHAVISQPMPRMVGAAVVGVAFAVLVGQFVPGA